MVLIVIVIVIILACQLLGEVKAAAGKLLIPTAGGEKPYNCVMVITRAGIEIECALKIFQPFNQFDAPKQTKIRVNTAEVEEIQIYKNKIYISTQKPFWKQYRNILQHLYQSKYVGFFEYIYIEKWVLLFALDNSADIGAVSEALITIIGERCQIVKEG
jgi:hypothetical protein